MAGGTPFCSCPGGSPQALIILSRRSDVRSSNHSRYVVKSTRCRQPPRLTISPTGVHRNSLTARFSRMIRARFSPLSGHSTAYPASLRVLRICTTLSRASRCAAAPTFASTDAQGEAFRMIATFF
ncbi:MAG: hypothetical protein A4E42_01586 [Methanoregulaceae archaeon PtaU1.Bin222]|nr:MAG: hypothetical protein A4E42_01586 [Methanoregulaceae archaeon PtaU1.Bin222]